MKKKIAICLFGTFSSSKPKTKVFKLYDPYFNFKSLYNNLIKYYNADIFIHTWKNKYSSKILNLYKPVKYKIEIQKNFNTTLRDYSLEYIDLYDNISYLKKQNKNPKEEYNNLIFRSHSRWYSQKEAIRLMTEHSIKNKIKYEFVIQTRFDLILNKKIELNNFNKTKLHLVNAGRLQNKNRLYDIFFISNFKTSKIFMGVFKNLKSYPIDPTLLLPIFLRKKNISYEKSINFKDVILKRHQEKYFEITLFENIKLKFKSLLLKLFSKIYNFLNKVENLLINWI